MALVFGEMDRGKTIARSASNFCAETKPHFILKVKKSPDRLTRSLILTNFGSISRNLEDIFQS